MNITTEEQPVFEDINKQRHEKENTEEIWRSHESARREKKDREQIKQEYSDTVRKSNGEYLPAFFEAGAKDYEQIHNINKEESDNKKEGFFVEFFEGEPFFQKQEYSNHDGRPEQLFEDTHPLFFCKIGHE